MKDWKAYRDINPNDLALRIAGEDDASYVLRQVEGWQRLRKKVPSWANLNDLLYPRRLSIEQCSSEHTALYKTRIIENLLKNLSTAEKNNLSMADLTGGIGIDFSKISTLFNHNFYVEQQEELCQIAAHNFQLLDLKHYEIVCENCVDFLKRMPNVSLIYMDPARRNANGNKMVHLKDCEPNVEEYLPLLLKKAYYVILKLSPMLDLKETIRSLGSCIREIHIVSYKGECKELLIVLDKTWENKKGKQTQIIVNDDGNNFLFTEEEEKSAISTLTENCEEFLYEPTPALLKAGAFHLIGVRYHLKKLHSNSHLYTANKRVNDFPGRIFRIEKTYRFSKSDLRALHDATGSYANISVRNFPLSAAELHRKLRLKDGGDAYLFATTITPSHHILILCRK